MKNFFSSFYARLSVIFLLLLVLMGTIYIVISVSSSIAFVEEAGHGLTQIVQVLVEHVRSDAMGLPTHTVPTNPPPEQIRRCNHG